MTKKLLNQTPIDADFLKSISDCMPEKEPPLKAGYIPVSAPSITSREISLVNAALRKKNISGNSPEIEQFESLFAKEIADTKYAIAVNSGTSALMITMALIDLKPGDEVIVPSFTFIGTINMIRLYGAKPILIDSDMQTWNIDITKIESHITPRTRAIIPVHIYGLPCDMDPINEIAKKHNIWVIEDSAEALGSEYHGRRTGSLADCAIFSLYANKTITTGEGGVITTNNPEVAKRAKLLRAHAFSEDMHFWHSMLGFGVRMPSLQAALGIAQTQRFKSLLQKRLKVAAYYESGLKKIPGITLRPQLNGHLNTHWMFGILINRTAFGMSKNELRNVLAKNNIETRSFFIPAHLQPIYYKEYDQSQFPVANQLCREGLYLPTSAILTQKDLKKVVGCIQDACKG